jgi:flagellar basal-body rod protein FlgB
MFAQMNSALDFQAKALVVRAERQRVIASNIANADTPGYAARELNFQEAMSQASGSAGLSLATPSSINTSLGAHTTHARHIPLSASTGELGSTQSLAYTTPTQPSMDNNSVDLDRERSKFVDNAVRYESTLRFINSQSKTLLSAIQGQ